MTTKVTDSSLTTTGVSAGTYGSASNTHLISVNSAGRVTSITNVVISIANTQISGVVNTSANLLTANGFSISESAGKLYFKYGNTALASLDQRGNLVVANTVTTGTP